MRRFIECFGAGMGVLLLSGAVAYAGQNVSGAEAGGYKVPGLPFPVNFDPDIFDETSATIDNPWWPLPPGKQLTWEGSALDDEGERIPRKVVFTVTDMTKEIAGVENLIIWERDYDEDGMVIESELLFLAQAKDGTVWHFGEAVEHWEYDEDIDARDHYTGTRVWMVGYLEGCKAGIYMLADPKLGAPGYSQGFVPSPYDWDDWGEIYQTGLDFDTPAGKFTDVMAIREWEPRAPGVSQLKYYARGVGTVGVGWLGEADTEREEMRLTKNVMLNSRERAAVRAAVRTHESKSYMYSLTSPAKSMGGETAAADEAVAAADRAAAAAKAAQVRKVSDERATEIALGTVAGEATNIGVETKLGKEVIVVEVLTEDGAEVDVLIDMESGEVLGTDD